MSKPIFVGVDRNGTKIYHDYTCDRCGGAGGADAWKFTGWTCYKCGGTGRQDKPHVIKEYTPEYEAKLAAQRAKRREKLRLQRIEDLKGKLPEMLEARGWSRDGKLYVVTGDTYSIKDELREAGAKWKPSFNSWAFTEPQDKYPTVELSWDELLELDWESGYLHNKDEVNARELIESKLPKKEKAVSEYLGEIGKRLEVEVTLVDVFSWDVPSYSPWGGDITKVLYKFVDAQGNILVWATTGFGLDATQYPKGALLKIKGTVKEHKEYKGDKQTVLQRVKAA